MDEVTWQRCAPGVRAIAIAMVGPGQADDVVQETFTRAAGQPLPPDACPVKWSKGIARNVARETVRHLRRWSALDEIGNSALPSVPDSSDELLTREAELLTREQVAKMLSGLSDRDREAVWLRDAMDFSVPDIAQRLGMTGGATRVLLHRIRTAMRAAAAVLAVLLGRVGRRAATVAPVAIAVALVMPALVQSGPEVGRIAAPLRDSHAVITSPAPSNRAVTFGTPEQIRPPAVPDPEPSAVPQPEVHQERMVDAGPAWIGERPPATGREVVVTTCVDGLGATIDPGLGNGERVDTCPVDDSQESAPA